MKRTLVNLDLSENNAAWRHNHDLLRVEGECTGVYIPEVYEAEKYADIVPNGYYVSTIEAYASGEKNVYLRKFDGKHAGKLIQVRKES